MSQDILGPMNIKIITDENENSYRTIEATNVGQTLDLHFPKLSTLPRCFQQPQPSPVSVWLKLLID